MAGTADMVPVAIGASPDDDLLPASDLRVDGSKRPGGGHKVAPPAAAAAIPAASRSVLHGNIALRTEAANAMPVFSDLSARLATMPEAGTPLRGIMAIGLM